MSYMEDLYKGRFDWDTFDSYQENIRKEKIEKIIEAYRELLKANPPDEIEKKGKISKKLLKDMASIGLFGLIIPEKYGGLGLTLQEYLQVVAQMAKLDLSVSLVSLAHLSIGIKGLIIFGNKEQKEKYLPKAASGECIFSYALTEPKYGSDARHIETRAELSEDGNFYILNGQKTYITNANYAGALTVFAQMDPKNPGYMGAFIVETSWEGVTIHKDMSKMGLKASSTASISFENVRVPKENLIGKPGDGYKIALTILSYGRLGLCAASAGIMEQSLEDMIKRAKSRYQFGKPIEDFELVQEMIVKAFVNKEIARAMVFFTAHTMERSSYTSVAIETSHCKLFGTTRAWDVLYDALQIHGGAGYLTTLPFEKRLRDFRVTTIFEGTTEIHSIYPPLWIIRRWSKEISGMSKIDKVKWALNLLAPQKSWPSWGEEKELSKAKRLCEKMSKAVRRLIIWGMAEYGQEITEKEFFLRRITLISLYNFGLIAMAAYIRYLKKTGKLAQTHLKVLEYFTEEAKAIYKTSQKYLIPYKEIIHKKLIKNILKA